LAAEVPPAHQVVRADGPQRGSASRPEGGTVMPLVALAVAALAIGFEQLIQWEYGPMGIIAFVALSVGLKARNTMISGIGAVILVMLLAQSG
jgi:hypothetical protein